MATAQWRLLPRQPAEEQLYATEIASEGKEIDDFPDRETAELAIVLEREGLTRQQAETVALGLASNPNVFLRTKVQKDSDSHRTRAATRSAIVVGATYLGAAIVPLWPYFFPPTSRSRSASSAPSSRSSPSESLRAA
jgi:VIT1/CCC1 family predicted Fe2+/Mn2+ transporter